MPDPQLTDEEIAAILQQENGGSLPVVPGRPPELPIEGPPPDPNDPHNQYMEAAQEPEAPPMAGAGAASPPPAAAPLAPRKEAKPPPAPAPPPKDEVVSTKPGWYEAMAPPPTSPIPGVVGGLGLGMLGALLARKSPGVAAGLAGLGGLSALQSVADAPQREFDNRTSAAERQAAMHAKLTGHGDSEMERERARLAAEKWEAKQAEDARKATEAKALGDMNSPETIKERQIALDLAKGMAGGPSEAQLAQMNGADIRRWRTGLQQQAGQARGQTNAVTNHNMRTDTQVELKDLDNAEWRARQGVEQGSQIAKEDREQVKLDEQSEITGYHYVGKRAPNIAAVEAARKLADSTEVAEMSANNMVELWKQLNTESKLAPGWAEGALSDKQRSIVNELRTWGLTLDTAQRQLANMGVPQQFEMEIMRSVSPDATGIRALLNNGQAWAAQGRVLHQLSNKRMGKYGYGRDEDGVAPAQPPSSGDKPLADKLQEAGQATQGLTQQVVGAAGQVANNTANTVSQVAGAAEPAMKTFQVKVWDPAKKLWGPAIARTQEQIDAARAKLKAKGLPDSMLSIGQ